MDKERIAKTESVFREVNEAIAKTAEHLEADETDFVCECANAECADRITAELDEYDEIREDPTRFILVPGHQEPAVERIVERTGRYAVVEKFDRTVVQIVRRLNPRAA